MKKIIVLLLLAVHIIQGSAKPKSAKSAGLTAAATTAPAASTAAAATAAHAVKTEAQKTAHLLTRPEYVAHTHARLVMREILGNHPEIVAEIDKHGLKDAKPVIYIDALGCPTVRMILGHGWVSNAVTHLKEEPITGKICYGFACRKLLDKYSNYDDGNRFCINCHNIHGFTDYCYCRYYCRKIWERPCNNPDCPEKGPRELDIDKRVRDNFLRIAQEVDRAQRNLDSAQKYKSEVYREEEANLVPYPVFSMKSVAHKSLAAAEKKYSEALKAYNGAVEECGRLYPNLLAKLTKSGQLKATK